MTTAPSPGPEPGPAIPDLLAEVAFGDVLASLLKDRNRSRRDAARDLMVEQWRSEGNKTWSVRLPGLGTVCQASLGEPTDKVERGTTKAEKAAFEQHLAGLFPSEVEDVVTIVFPASGYGAAAQLAALLEFCTANGIQVEQERRVRPTKVTEYLGTLKIGDEDATPEATEEDQEPEPAIRLFAYDPDTGFEVPGVVVREAGAPTEFRLVSWKNGAKDEIHRMLRQSAAGQLAGLLAEPRALTAAADDGAEVRVVEGEVVGQ